MSAVQALSGFNLVSRIDHPRSSSSPTFSCSHHASHYGRPEKPPDPLAAILRSLDRVLRRLKCSAPLEHSPVVSHLRCHVGGALPQSKCRLFGRGRGEERGLERDDEGCELIKPVGMIANVEDFNGEPSMTRLGLHRGIRSDLPQGLSHLSWCWISTV